jgi:hypothetical protein
MSTETESLYNAVTNFDNNLLAQSEYKYFIKCCCISEKWCFNHIGIATISEYDESINNYCTCLDCCTWCLEFRFEKMSTCKKETNCYLCCCVIYFTE